MKKEPARTIIDPDFGPVRIPAFRRPTAKQWAEAKRQFRERVRKRRAFKPGEAYDCERCGKHTYIGTDDLTHAVTRGDHTFVFMHMRGAQCTSCGCHTIEAYDQILLEEEIGTGLVATFDAKVTRIGSGSLGTYWPKDVERVLGLEPGTRAMIELAGRDSVLVRFVRPKKAPKESQP